jgi:hypothetical protein
VVVELLLCQLLLEVLLVDTLAELLCGKSLSEYLLVTLERLLERLSLLPLAELSCTELSTKEVLELLLPELPST